MKFKARKILVEKACRRQIQIKKDELEKAKIALVERHSKKWGYWFWRVEGVTNYDEAYKREQKSNRYGSVALYKIEDLEGDIEHMKVLIEICALKTIDDGIELNIENMNKLDIRNAFKKIDE